MPRSKKVPVEEVVSSEASDMQSGADESEDARSSVTATSDSDTESAESVQLEPVPKKKSTRHKAATVEQPKERKHHKPKMARSTQDSQIRKPSKTPSKRAKSDGEARKHTKRSKVDSEARKHTSRSKADSKPRPKSPTKAADTESESEEGTEDDEDSYDMTGEIVEKYRAKVRKFIRNDNMFGFVKVLTESPLATVLENMHYLFVASSHNDDMLSELTRVNKDFNIVSKKFIKAVRESEDCRHKYTESEAVAESIANNTPLKQIPSISEYTPEFIVMKTIQSGDLVTCNLMLKKWDIAPMFAASKVLVAAFYGWEDFFGNTERFTKSQDLVVHALCGGYKRVLSLVCRGSGSKWVLPETLQKAGLVLPVRADMKKKFKQLMDDRL